jgi:hypothetical protein|nr:MAG TPA: hypothetical protein [Caudoviricetes sp.]
MKVLDHVPPTMHNFVTEAFKTIYMGYDCFLGPAEPCPANPQLWRKFFGADGWNRQGAYDFGATFTGCPTDPYRTHKIEAHLLISGLYDDVYIEWEANLEDLVLYGHELGIYWPEAARELESFTFETYRGSLQKPESEMRLREFIEDLPML